MLTQTADENSSTNITNARRDPSLADALAAMALAQTHFDYASNQREIDAACLELTAVELLLRAAIRRGGVEQKDEEKTTSRFLGIVRKIVSLN